jgi:excisionase family DNA binding protein
MIPAAVKPELVAALLLTEAEAAKLLKRDRRTLYAARAAGEIPFVQFTEGGRIYFRPADLAAYIARHTVTARPVEVAR